jgi:hypothetical protein
MDAACIEACKNHKIKTSKLQDDNQAHLRQSFLTRAVGAVDVVPPFVCSTTSDPTCTSLGADEVVIDTSSAAAEDPVGADTDVLFMPPLRCNYVVALALSTSSLAWVERSPRLEIIKARWQNVGGFLFGAIAQLCRTDKVST